MEGEAAAEEEGNASPPSKSKKKKMANDNTRNISASDSQAATKKKSKNDVTVEVISQEDKTSPKKTKKTPEYSVPKEQREKVKVLPENDAIIVVVPAEKVISRNKKIDTSSNAAADGKSKSRVAKYAVNDYIPLGASHR